MPRSYHMERRRNCEMMAAMRTLFPLTLLMLVQPAAGQLAFTAPAAWHARPTSSSMRVAEFVVPRAPGDPEDAEVVIYYFGGGGGSVDANVDRWIGQMHQPDGSPSKDKARRGQRIINGLKVSTVDVTGTYVAEVRPGATEHLNKPDFRLRAAVVETPKGAYYVKMTGPSKTVTAADADFKALLASLHF
jgi:hypothetical protein